MSQHPRASRSEPVRIGAAGLWRGYRGRLGAGLLCLIGVAASTAAYAYLSGPVVALILGAGSPPSRAPLSALLPLPARGPGLWQVALLLVAVALLKGLCQLGASWFLEGSAERIGKDLRDDLYRHLLRVPLRVHRQHALGDLLARLLDDVRRVQESVVAAPLLLVRELLGALALLAVALWTAPRLALLAALVLPLAGLAISLLGRSVKSAAGRAQAELGALAARASQGLTAIREVKSSGAEDRELRRLTGHAAEALRWSLRHLLARALAPLANETMAAAALGVVLLHAGRQVGSGALAPERFLSFFTAALLLYRPLKEIGRALHLRAAGRASLERLEELRAAPEEEELAAGLPPLPPLSRRLLLEEIVFSYPDGPPVLRGINLALPVGQVVALTGVSGSGKSTLINLVCGLERAGGGRLLWDDLDLQLLPLRALRGAVALVPQQPLLLDGTVEENLRFGAPQADPAALAVALRSAGLQDLVAALPQQLQTRLGAGGQLLSAGEAQRLALARALLRPASLIILDEPASALDPANQEQLTATLRRVAAAGKAVLLAAHGEQLLAAADQVWDLAEGRLTSRASR